MIKVSHKNLVRLLENIKCPVMIHGTFGIGKSVAVRDYARNMAAKVGLEFSESPKDINADDKFVLIRLPLHQLDVAELKGIPYPSGDREKTIFLPIGLLPLKGQGVLFLDEINLAPPAVQANAYQLVLDRQLGFYEVPKGYTILATGNSLSDKANVFDMPYPLRNRFAHLMLMTPTVDEWIGWAAKAQLDSRVVAFLSWRRDYLHAFNPDSDEDVFSIPTPRAWEFASRNIEGVTDHELIRDLVGCVVGEGIGMEFAAWLALSQEYDIAGIFKTKKIDMPKKIDVLYSLMAAIIGYYVDAPTEKNANTLFDLAFQFQREHTMMILSLVSKKDTEFFNKVDKQKMDKVADEIIALLL